MSPFSMSRRLVQNVESFSMSNILMYWEFQCILVIKSKLMKMSIQCKCSLQIIGTLSSLPAHLLSVVTTSSSLISLHYQLISYLSSLPAHLLSVFTTSSSLISLHYQLISYLSSLPAHLLSVFTISSSLISRHYQLISYQSSLPAYLLSVFTKYCSRHNYIGES